MSDIPKGFRVISTPQESDIPEGFRVIDAKPKQSFNQRLGANIKGVSDAIGRANVAQGAKGIGILGNVLGDTVADPIETLIKSPARAASRLPSGAVNQIEGIAGMIEAPFDKDKSFKDAAINYGKALGGQSLDALEASAFIPPAKGLSMAGSGLRQGVRGAAQQEAATDPVMNALLKMAKAEGVKPQELAQKAAMEPEQGAMVFQQLGLPQTAQGLGNRAGPSREIMQDAAQNFQAGQSGRVENIIKGALGNPDADMSVESIVAGARQKAKPFYDKALAPNVQPDFAKLLETPALKQYVDQAQNKLAGLGQNTPSQMELLHQAQQLIGGKAQKYGRAGDTYEAGLAGQLRGRLMDIGKEASPDYAKATSIYKDDMQFKDAFELGQGALSSKNAQQFAKQAEKLTPEQKQAAAAGLMQSVQSKLDLPESYSAIRAEFRKPSFRNNLAALTNQKQADEAIDALLRQAELAEMANNANFARGSKTAPTQQAIGMVDTAATSGVRRIGGQAAGYIADRGIQPLEMFRDLTRAGGRRVQSAVNAPDEDVVSEVARLLTQDTATGLKALQNLPQPQQQQALALVEQIRAGLIQSGQSGVQGFTQSAPFIPASLAAGQVNQ